MKSPFDNVAPPSVSLDTMQPSAGERLPAAPRCIRSSPFCTLVCSLAVLLSIHSIACAQPPVRRDVDFGIPQVRQINQEVRQVWSDYQIRPANAAADGKWCRRVFLDVLGRIPTVDELTEYMAARGGEKRQQLVEDLLSDSRYQADYERNWSNIWTNVLIGRSGGSERNSLTDRTGMQSYLRECFATNRSYDEMVYDLITATGTNAPGLPDFNGAVNFLAMKVNDENGALATSATARIFMGLQVQCTQCHNHPFNNCKQQKFWEFNAFFRQTRALRRFEPGTRRVVAAELVNQDFAGEDRSGDPTTAPIFYELRNGLLKVAYPVFVDGTEVGESGLVEQLNRREKLGQLILQSDYVDKMLVNRYWAHFMGYGFTKPIDDLGPHNAPSHPALLEYLAEQIRDQDYDLKQLIRWIVLSEPYSLSSHVNRHNRLDDPLAGEPPKFSRFYLRQMRAEELYESLLVATKANLTSEQSATRESSRARWLSQFVTAIGNDEGEESTTFNGTIPQTLMMFNGELMAAATSAKPGNFLWELAGSRLPPKQTIQQLFLAGLARRPNREEVEVANRLLMARTFDQAAPERRQRGSDNVLPPGIGALEDLWWAILNSNEFITNH